MAKKDEPIPPRPPRGGAFSWDAGAKQREWDKKYGGMTGGAAAAKRAASPGDNVKASGKGVASGETPAQKKARENLERQQAEAAKANAPDLRRKQQLERVLARGNPQQKEDARKALEAINARLTDRGAAQAQREKKLREARSEADKKAIKEQLDAEKEDAKRLRMATKQQEAEEQAARKTASKNAAAARQQQKDEETLARLEAIAERAKQSGDYNAQLAATRAAHEWANSRGVGRQPRKSGISDAERQQNRTGYGGGGGI